MSKNELGGQKKLALFDLVALGVGAVIGSGIFAMIGMGISMTGRSVNLALVMGIVFITLMMVPSIYVSSVIPLEGGNYTQAAVLMKKGMLEFFLLFSSLQI